MSKLLATDIVNKFPKVLIAGMGWLGEPLAASLQSLGCEISGLVRSEESRALLESKGYRVKSYSLPLEFNDDFPFADAFDVAIVAIPPGVRGGRELNQAGFQSLSAAIRARGTSKLILVSSTGIYPEHELEVDENTKPDPSSDLLKMENCFADWGEDLSIIRFAGLIGPNRYPGRFYAGKSGVADPDTPVNLIHLEDCIGIIERVLAKEAFGKCFNGVYPHHPSRKEFYTQAAIWAGMLPPQFEESGAIRKKVHSALLESILDYHFVYDDLFEATKSILIDK